MNIKKLNEEIRRVLKESNNYTLKIIVGRDRDSEGEIIKNSFTAKNDFDALLKVFQNYDLQNSGYINGEYDDEMEEDEIERKNKVLEIAKTGKNIKEGIKILTDLYFDNFDPTDYYDDIISLTAPDGHVVIEDDSWDEEAWDEDEDEYEDEYEDENEYEDEDEDEE